MTGTKYHDLLLSMGTKFAQDIASIGAQADAEIGPTPPPTGFFSGGGVSYATQFNRTWTGGQIAAMKQAGMRVMAITDDYWAAGAPQRDPHTTIAYQQAKLAIAAGIKVYIRLWCPGSNSNHAQAFPPCWVAYCTAWSQAIDHDFGSGNAAINYQNEPGQSNWHDIFTQCYNAARAIDKNLTIGYTPAITANPDGHWDWFPDYQNWAPPADVWLDFHSYGEGVDNGNKFMNQGVNSWAGPPKSVPWLTSYAATFAASWKRFTDLATQRKQAGVLIGELGASIIPAPTTQDNINCTKDLWAVCKQLGIATMLDFNNRPQPDYATEDNSGNLLPWVSGSGILTLT